MSHDRTQPRVEPSQNTTQGPSRSGAPTRFPGKNERH